MPTGVHYNTQAQAEVRLTAMGWLETALNTWTSPDGDHVASFAAFIGGVIEVRVREVVS